MLKQKLLTVLAAIGIIATTTFADVEINETNFPDVNFRNWIKAQSYGKDGKLTDVEIAAVKSINVSSKSISELTGIEHFTALEDLWCASNQLTSLDVSGLTNLTELYCEYNKLAILDVSGAIALTILHCYDSKLTSLDVSELTNLTTLHCHRNQIISLDVSGATALTTLHCYDNKVTSLDVSGFTNLTDLRCYRNELTSLDVSGATALSYLSCDGNELISLDVSSNTALAYLSCADNQLTELNVGEFTKLKELNCYSNYITSLDVGEATELKELRCHENHLTSLDISGATVLYNLFCSDNQLTSLDASGLTKLSYLSCGNNYLTSLDVSGAIALNNLICDDNELISLDVSEAINLQSLNCEDNYLTSLDISGAINLQSLNCRHNELTSLDVSELTKLSHLNCDDNQITSLDVSKLTNLKILYCDENQITELDVSTLTYLETLYCGFNYLTSLDVSGLTALKSLLCYFNNMIDESDVIGVDAKKWGNGNFTFSPQKTNISSVEIPLEYDTKEYNGEAYEPKLMWLTEGTDYTISYSDNINAGTASVTVTGMGHSYMGTATKTFTITPKELTVSGATVTEKVYDGGTSATINGATLVGAFKNEVSLANATTGTFADKNAGTNKTVTTAMLLSGTGKDNYLLTQPTLIGTITAKPLADEMIAPIPQQNYTGDVITPEITVKDGETTLTKNTDYAVVYSNNTEIGTATVTVMGAGNYMAIATATFDIAKGTTAIKDDNNKQKDKMLFKSTIVSDKMEIILDNFHNISFIVYDMTGNIVADGNGRTWDLRNSAGRFVANGSYLVVVEAKDGKGKISRYSAKLGVKR